MADDQLPLPVIDSHVNLYPSSEVASLDWDEAKDGSVPQQKSIEELKEATKTTPSFLGYICVEANRKHDLEKGIADGSGWEAPLQEVRWMKRLALGQLNDGDGHAAEDAKLCLGLVPWAPIPSGPAVLEKYLDLVKEAAGDAWPKIKGFRYSLHDKPHGTMLTDDFIGSLKLLGRKGLTFDVAVDHHTRGRKQLDELIEMVDRVHDGVPTEEKVTLIIDHVGKPDLTIYNTMTDPSVNAWRNVIYALEGVPQVYLKLSGLFDKMPANVRNDTPLSIFTSSLAWFSVILGTFGAERVMFGSDWPTCDTDLGAEAWQKWKDVVDKTCWMASQTEEQRAMILGGTAKKAYHL